MGNSVCSVSACPATATGRASDCAAKMPIISRLITRPRTSLGVWWAIRDVAAIWVIAKPAPRPRFPATAKGHVCPAANSTNAPAKVSAPSDSIRP